MVGDEREGFSATCCFFYLFFTLSYIPLALSSHFSTPPSFKFDSGNVIHLYSVVSLFLSPLPLFLSAVRVE